MLSSGDDEVAGEIERAGVPGCSQALATVVNVLTPPAAKAGLHVHLPAHRILSHRVPRRPLLLVEGRCRRCRHLRVNAWAAYVFNWSRVGGLRSAYDARPAALLDTAAWRSCSACCFVSATAHDRSIWLT